MENVLMQSQNDVTLLKFMLSLPHQWVETISDSTNELQIHITHLVFTIHNEHSLILPIQVSKDLHQPLYVVSQIRTFLELFKAPQLSEDDITSYLSLLTDVTLKRLRKKSQLQV